MIPGSILGVLNIWYKMEYMSFGTGLIKWHGIHWEEMLEALFILG